MGHACTDDELVAASRRGERDAFGRLIERHLDAVWAVSYSSTRDQSLSDDVAQDTFVAAWAQLDRLREVARLRAWLCGIARNLARKARRRAGRERPLEPVHEPAAADTPFEAMSQAQTDRVVQGALRTLPAAYREVLVLYYQHERSIRDVATALGIREEAAMQRLSRGRRLLAAHLAEQVEGALTTQRRPRPALVAGVLAVIPPRASLPGWASRAPAGRSSSSARVEPMSRPSTTSGASMFRLAAIVLATAGAAGTTYLVTRGPASAASPGVAASSAAAPIASSHARAATPTVRVAPRPAPVDAPAVAPTPGAGSCDPGEPGACERHAAADGAPVAPADIERVGLYRGPSRGPVDAPIQIAVYQDLECPYCATVMGTIDQLWDEYPGQLRLVVKDFPLPHHVHAQLAAEAVRAADAQGKLWEFRDLALAFQDDLTRPALLGLAARAGLDVARFTDDLDQHRYADLVAADVAGAQAIEVQGTPAFFINGRRYEGAQPIAVFRAAIDAAR